MVWLLRVVNEVFADRHELLAHWKVNAERAEVTQSAQRKRDTS